jgi:hypothetical protein
VKIQLDIWTGFTKSIDDIWKKDIHSGTCETDRQLPRLSTTSSSCLGHRCIQIGEERARSLEQDFTSACQSERSGAPLEQRDAKLFLELLDLLTKRGLSYVQPFGCARKAQLLADRHEVTKMAQFHAAAYQRVAPPDNGVRRVLVYPLLRTRPMQIAPDSTRFRRQEPNSLDHVHSAALCARNPSKKARISRAAMSGISA